MANLKARTDSVMPRRLCVPRPRPNSRACRRRDQNRTALSGLAPSNKSRTISGNVTGRRQTIAAHYKSGVKLTWSGITSTSRCASALGSRVAGSRGPGSRGPAAEGPAAEGPAAEGPAAENPYPSFSVAR